MTLATGTISLTAEREKADMLPRQSRELYVALLYIATLEHVRACMVLAIDGTSEACNRILAVIDGVPNPKRPYLTWECCGIHHQLKKVREGLEKQASELGIRLVYDYSRPIED